MEALKNATQKAKEWDEAANWFMELAESAPNEYAREEASNAASRCLIENLEWLKTTASIAKSL